MHKIITQMGKYVDSKDVLKDVYGISSNNHFDLCILTPTWEIEKFIGGNKVKYEKLLVSRFSRSYDIQMENKRILYVVLQIGSPNIVDFCLACYKLNCNNFIFMGSVGAIVKDINIGDCVIPGNAISGNGATMFLSDNIKNEFWAKSYSNKELNSRLAFVCKNQGFNVLDKVVISVDTIFAEYTHLDEFRQLGAQLVDMETASFFESMKIINKKGSALLLVSDNSANGEHLISNHEEQFKKYLENRNKIFKIINEI